MPFWNGVKFVMCGIIDIDVFTFFELFPVLRLVLASAPGTSGKCGNSFSPLAGRSFSFSLSLSFFFFIVRF